MRHAQATAGGALPQKSMRQKEKTKPPAKETSPRHFQSALSATVPCSLLGPLVQRHGRTPWLAPVTSRPRSLPFPILQKRKEESDSGLPPFFQPPLPRAHLDVVLKLKVGLGHLHVGRTGPVGRHCRVERRVKAQLNPAVCFIGQKGQRNLTARNAPYAIFRNANSSYLFYYSNLHFTAPKF